MADNVKQSPAESSPAALIDARIAELADWRGVPTWYHDGIICTGETYEDKVKVTFFKGAALDDPAGLFNSSLEGNTRRAIDISAGDTVDDTSFTDLVRAAVKVYTRQ
ncbi:MAG: DUF1801 domain-containing protein [Mycobacterium sp.]